MLNLPGFAVQALLREGRTLRVEALDHGVVRLVLARPEVRNAFDALMIHELTEALGALADGALPRLLLLEGEGKVFCAGADLAYMRAQAAADAEANLADARALGRLFRTLAAFPAPTLAVVRGAAIGGGLGLTACCDLAVAEASALFATSEVRLGIVPATISPYVVRRVGLSQAAPLLLGGGRIGALEAHRLGLVHRLVGEDETLEGAVAALLADLLQAGPEAARRTKDLLLRECPLPDASLEELTARTIAEVRAGEEAREGLSAFFERRAPRWVPEESR